MIAITLDVGNHVATMNAPGLQSIVGEIFNFSHPTNPSSLYPSFSAQ
jgi:hypothetical protein